MGEDEIDAFEDIESYAPSITSIDTTITLIALLHIFAGIIPIPILMTLFSTDIYQVPLIITYTILIAGAVLVGSIPLYFILGWAIWSLQRWAWKIAVIANVVFLLVYLMISLVLPALLSIVFIFALYSSDVKAALAPI
ncbi:MAG: hypothetical protein RTV31_14505 [Candidatus Thorarchaeota archaeon]